MNSITLPVNELRPALAGLRKIIGTRTTLPVLSHIRLVRTSLGRIELAATDLDAAAVVAFNTRGPDEPFTLLVPHDDINNVAKSCGRDDALVITAVDKQRLALKFPVAGTIVEHRCETLPVEEFPEIGEIRAEAVPLNSDIRHSIHQAIECASRDATRLILNGAYLDVSKPKAHYVVGTDGRHLFSSNSFALPLRDSLIIPSHRFLDWKEFNSDGDWKLRVSNAEKDKVTRFEIASDHWRFIARSFEGNYPNWRQVVPESGSAKTTVEIDPQSVDALVQTIARFPNHDPVNFSIRVAVLHGRMALVVKSAGEEQWKPVEIESAKARGNSVTFSLNRNLLSKALRFGLTRIDVIDPLTPIRFSNGGRQMIVVPLRPDADPRPMASTTPVTVPPAANTNPPPAPAETSEENKMPEENGNPSSGASRSATTNAGKPVIETALAQVEVMRGEFKNSLAGLNKLAESLKQAQRESKGIEKEIQSVRQTLRSLQSVRI